MHRNRGARHQLWAGGGTVQAGGGRGRNKHILAARGGFFPSPLLHPALQDSHQIPNMGEIQSINRSGNLPINRSGNPQSIDQAIPQSTEKAIPQSTDQATTQSRGTTTAVYGPTLASSFDSCSANLFPMRLIHAQPPYSLCGLGGPCKLATQRL